jgi:hypothetical protein
MTEAFMVTEPGSVRVRLGGPATANVWLSLNGCEFPMRGWNDFAIVVLGWWAIALLRLVRNASTRETVHFMEGPYSVEVTSVHAGMLQLRALEGSGRNREAGTGEVQAIPFVLELISQSREVLEACRRQGWWSKDADTLESALEALEQESSGLQS